jgi:hypothetical protein
MASGNQGNQGGKDGNQGGKSQRGFAAMNPSVNAKLPAKAARQLTKAVIRMNSLPRKRVKLAVKAARPLAATKVARKEAAAK